MNQYLNEELPVVSRLWEGRLLFKRVDKERECMGYSSPFVMQGLERSVKGKVSESVVKHLHTSAHAANAQQMGGKGQWCKVC